MKMEVLQDDELTAKAAAKFIAAEALQAIRERGRFTLAVSGGRSPWIMLRALAEESLPWEKVHLLQVDERVAPAGDKDRNLTHITESLLKDSHVKADRIYAMPVESNDLKAAADKYASTLKEVTGSSIMIDLVHLGLGPDGHTASLVPGDPVLEVTDRDVAITGVYQGRQRMTLTYPAIDRASRILWLVTGEEKAEMLARLLKADPSIPSGRVRQQNAVIFADRGAAREN